MSAVYANQGTIAATAIVSRDPDRSGNFWCDGTADNVEIQAAIAYANAVSATWKAKVVLIGDFTISAALVPTSYIILELQGSITLANGANTDLITVATETEIEIHGGEWDGNAANQAADLDGFSFVTCTHCLIRDVTLHDIDQTVSDGHGMRIITSSDVVIEHCTIYNCGDIAFAAGGSGVQLNGSSNCVVTDCSIHDCLGGIYLYTQDGVVDNNRVEFNEIWDIHRDGISLYPDLAGGFCRWNVVIGNIITDASKDGTHTCIKVGDDGTCNFNDIVGNIMSESAVDSEYGNGITLFNDCQGNNISGNVINNMWDTAILIGTENNPSMYNLINDNVIHTVRQASSHGIELQDADYNTVNGNRLYDIANTALFCRLGASYNDFNDNHVHTAGNGIRVLAATEIENSFMGTRLDNVTVNITDVGTDTILPSVSFPFIQGTTFISAVANPWGWEIDADTEYAIALGQIPLDAQMVYRIKIWAVGLADPGAGNYMRAQFTGEGASSHEIYTTEAIDVVDKNCVEEDSSVDDVIHWMLTASDDAAIDDLIGGDSIQFKVLHEDGAGDDIETDAIFRVMEIVYV